jgi:predicted negative regulator of RcsB-dependent stress response
MQLSKHFSKNGWTLFVLLAGAAQAAVPTGQTLSSCLENGKAQYAQAQYTQAQKTFEKCLALDENNVEAHLSLAGVLLTQNDLSGAQTHFERALKQMKRTSPYWSYTYSMLGDIALKRQDHKEALNMYQKSLQYNPANVNSLIGKGIILEMQGNQQGAAENYQAALAVEPLNVIARQRLVNLEPEYLTDEEMLLALKQRYAVKPEATELTDKNRELFTRIHQAEQRRGVDYLKNKYGANTQDYIVTLNKGTDFAREMLSLNGYNTSQKDMGQDALAVFSQLKIPVQDVFALRDKHGKPVFTQDSTLTEEGFYVYTQALKGKKEYLLPNQAVPLTEVEIQKANRRADALTKKGYTEISRSELKMLETQTLCSEETLQKSLGVYYMPIAKKQYRYFVRTTDTDALKTVAYYYVMTARHKRNPKVEVPKNDLVEYYKYGGYTICLSDGNLTLSEGQN